MFLQCSINNVAILLQCSNIFLMKDQDIRLGKNFLSSTFVLQNLEQLLTCMTISGDFGLAKMLTSDELASSVSIIVGINGFFPFYVTVVLLSHWLFVPLCAHRQLVLPVTCARSYLQIYHMVPNQIYGPLVSKNINVLNYFIWIHK